MMALNKKKNNKRQALKDTDYEVEDDEPAKSQTS